MARKVIESLIDDKDGGQADETIRFAVDGLEYEIDLSYANANKLRETIDPYAQAGRKVGRVMRGSGQKGGVTANKLSAARLADIRSWAVANGHKVAARGRISGDIERAYNDARVATAVQEVSEMPTFVEPPKTRRKTASAAK